MVTAAIGAETFYTTENNAARTENLQQARDLDFKVYLWQQLTTVWSVLI